MPRRKETRRPLDKREKQICSRLREARERLNHSQEEVAAVLGIGRPKLAANEEKRAALKCETALRFCRYYMVSENWLALGIGNWRHYLTVERYLPPSPILLTARYSQVFDQFLIRNYEELAKRYSDRACLVLKEDDPPEILETVFNHMLPIWKNALSDKERAEFFDLLTKTAQKFMESLPTAAASAGEQPMKRFRGEIHTVEIQPKSSGVRNLT